VGGGDRRPHPPPGRNPGRLSPDNSKKRHFASHPALSERHSEKILEGKHAVRVQNIHQEKSFQDLLLTGVTFVH
jgi:hypothetical protein